MKDKKILPQPATKQDIVSLHKETASLRKEITCLHKEIAELHKEIVAIHKEIAGLHREIAELQQEMAASFEKLKNEISNQIDGLAKLIKDQTEEFQIHKMTHKREQGQLDNHEERIGSLEQTNI